MPHRELAKLRTRREGLEIRHRFGRLEKDAEKVRKRQIAQVVRVLHQARHRRLDPRPVVALWHFWIEDLAAQRRLDVRVADPNEPALK